MRKLLAAAALWAVASTAVAEGTVTISVDEYERLKTAVEAKKSGQLWNMTFQQILEREKGDTEDAWELYEYYVLRTIYLAEAVTGPSVGRLIGDIRILGEIDAEKPITLVISSGGGSVFDGLNLYNAMMASPAPVNTVCDGMALSMAAVILAAGEHRVARDGCMFMVHEVSVGAPGGQTTEHVKWTDTVISVENLLAEILSRNSGLSMADVRRVWEFESFYNAAETLALGFVDAVEGDAPRDLASGSRTIPPELLPGARIARQVSERMAE